MCTTLEYEGAVKDGRGETIWDKFAHPFGKVIDFSNADVAVNQYHLFNDDIQLIKNIGMDAYRFSIAWSRIFPGVEGTQGTHVIHEMEIFELFDGKRKANEKGSLILVK